VDGLLPDIHPKYANAWYYKGISFGELGKYEEAIKSYDKTLEIDQNHYDALYAKDIAMDKSAHKPTYSEFWGSWI
jgi:tetratricopeptide (TPR) repeat protein